jgi:hypothetical protein
LRWHGPQVARYGLRTGGSILRADLSAAAPTHAKEAQSDYSITVTRSAIWVIVPNFCCKHGFAPSLRKSSNGWGEKFLQGSVGKWLTQSYFPAGIAIGCTLPQSGPL